MVNAGAKVVVTTAHQGVFFGTVESYDPDRKSGVLLNVSNVLYWPKEVRGFIGLAVTGPLEGSRVGPAAPRMLVNDVTAILECLPEAVTAWESKPWTN